MSSSESAPLLNWAALGVPSARSIKLGEAARARLSHLADFRDVASPSQAIAVGGEYSGEQWLAADLLAVRPHLAPDLPRQDVLSAILSSEWTGLLALLGEYGPWVYAATVRDLQELTAAYSQLVTAAVRATEAQVYGAARRQRDFPSLLARLEVTDYRRAAHGHSAAPEPDSLTEFNLAELERQFWQRAQAQALRQQRARLK